MTSAPRIGNYELIDRYATGGVAEIYRARDVRNGEIVVIKRLRSDVELDVEQQAGFIRELQLALMCTHKNLIRGIEKGSAGGNDYGVLEYVDGQDLHRIADRARKANVKIPHAFATFIVGEILEGLDFAFTIRDGKGQQLGLVHRDLAPKNVFVRYDGQVRVADFGCSIASLQERFDKHAVVGTPGYMSPEQARGETLDARSDVYAAGLILFELLTGTSAFDVGTKKSDASVLKMHQQGKRKPIPADLPEDLAMVVDIATALDPDDRYQSAKDMRAGLKNTETPPDPNMTLGIATLVRKLFADEFRTTRLPGSPLPF